MKLHDLYKSTCVETTILSYPIPNNPEKRIKRDYVFMLRCLDERCCDYNFTRNEKDLYIIQVNIRFFFYSSRLDTQ